MQQYGVHLSETAVQRGHDPFCLSQVWFGISNYTQDGTYLEGRMRSHPLLARMGNDRLPAQTHQEPVTMLDLDESYSLKAQAEGSDVYKAADWR